MQEYIHNEVSRITHEPDADIVDITVVQIQSNLASLNYELEASNSSAITE